MDAGNVARSAHARLTSLDTLTDGGTRRASARGVEIRARRHSFAGKRGRRRRSVRPALAGGSSLGAADGQVRDRPRRAHERPACAPDLARRAARCRAAGDDRRRRPPPVRDQKPGALGCARPRRDLRARAAARRELPRPGRAGRADVTCLLRLGARRAHDGLDRPHDRLRLDRVRGRDRAALPRHRAGADRPDPAAADLLRGLGVLPSLPRAHGAAASALGRGGHARRGDGRRDPRREGSRRRCAAGRAVSRAEPRDRQPRARHRAARRGLPADARVPADARLARGAVARRPPCHLR